MELHALHGELAVAHAHDLAVLGFCSDLEALGQSRAPNRQRMVTRRHEGARQPAEHADAGMADRRGFPVDDLTRMHDLAAESLADRLMTEAHPQYRDPAGKFAHRRERDPRFGGSAGPGGNDHAFRSHHGDVRRRDLVVATHFDVGAELAQILHQIPGEGIVVVDHQNHARPSIPLKAISAARSTARALARVSCNSLSGTESATIPAPAWTCIWPSFTTAVRIAMARSISPLKPR